MTKGKDILSVIFLALICIVIAGIVKNLAGSNINLIIPSFVFIAIGLWIAYDYMMIKRYKAKERCMQNKMDELQDELEARILINQIAEESEDNRNIPDLEVNNNVIEPPEKRSDNEYDIDIYNAVSIKDMHTNMGCTGDTMLCNRMKYMAVQPQKSKEIRAQWNKYSFLPYLEEELQEHANREWWNSDHLENEM